MTHSTRVQVLRQWTRRIAAENAKRAERHAYYVANIDTYRAMGELGQESAEGVRLRNRLFDCLREGIDQLPYPTTSDLR